MSFANSAEGQLSNILQPAGIVINGENSWDPQVQDPRTYQRILRDGHLGIGESFMDKWWDCASLDELVCKIISNEIQTKIRTTPSLIANIVIAKIINMQSPKRSREVAERHYDLPVELYRSFLDENMQYTCGYWKNTDSLDDAQIQKMDLIARKLMLEPGMTVLDIGCGWGQLANHMAEKYGAEVTGITISNEQLAFAQSTHHKPKYVLKDYRDTENLGQFDRITAVGMIEHVGYKNYRPFMKVVRSLLKNDGMFLLHTIGDTKSSVTGNPWLNKYIFPNGMLPSEEYLDEATKGLLVKEDSHSFGPDYDKTLMAWFDNFNKNWPSLEGQLIDASQPSRGYYDERFYLMMKYYFLTCAGSFRSRKVMQLWQNVYSKNGIVGGYEVIR